MKNIIVILASLMLSVSAFAQNGKAMYQKYSDEPGVQAVYISPTMFRLIGNLPMNYSDTEVNLGPIVKSLTGFYLISSDKPAVCEKLGADMMKYINQNKYELLMEAKDDGENMKIFTVNEGEYITSLVMVAMDGSENTFICLDGKILQTDLENLLAEIDE